MFKTKLLYGDAHDICFCENQCVFLPEALPLLGGVVWAYPLYGKAVHIAL